MANFIRKMHLAIANECEAIQANYKYRVASFLAVTKYRCSLIIILFCVLALKCYCLEPNTCAALVETRDCASCNLKYTYTDSVKVVRLLMNVPNGQNTMVYFARKLCGVPYVAQTLDNNNDERLVVNLRQLDCTTYVENVLALTLCHKNNKNTFDDFCHYLQSIRYAGNEVSYVKRLHYFSQWIKHNEQVGYVIETQNPDSPSDKLKKELPSDIDLSTVHFQIRSPFTEVQTLNINYMSKHPQSYPMLVKHPAWIKDIAAMESKLTGTKCRYIPKSAIDNSELLRATIHDGDIIAITTNKRGLDISHVGIAVWHKNGLHLLNASSIHGKVVEEQMTLRDYLMKHPSQTGIRVVKVHE